jgi:hypothetical protein
MQEFEIKTCQNLGIFLDIGRLKMNRNRKFEKHQTIKNNFSMLFKIKKVYWLGPILGGVCASIVYNLILKAEDKEAKPEGYDKAQTKEIPE